MLFQPRAHGRIAEAVGLRAPEDLDLLLLRRVALDQHVVEIGQLARDPLQRGPYLRIVGHAVVLAGSAVGVIGHPLGPMDDGQVGHHAGFGLRRIALPTPAFEILDDRPNRRVAPGAAQVVADQLHVARHVGDLAVLVGADGIEFRQEGIRRVHVVGVPRGPRAAGEHGIGLDRDVERIDVADRPMHAPQFVGADVARRVVGQIPGEQGRLAALFDHGADRAERVAAVGPAARGNDHAQPVAFGRRVEFL